MLDVLLCAVLEGVVVRAESLMHRCVLFQGNKLADEDLTAAIGHIDLGEEPSESDTDSLSTPGESPPRKAQTGAHCFEPT